MKVAWVELEEKGPNGPYGTSSDAYVVRIGKLPVSCYHSKDMADWDAGALNEEIRRLLGTDNVDEI